MLNVGYESLEDLSEDWRRVRAGKLPDPKPNCAINTLFDPSDAPDGCYTGLMRQFAPIGIGRGGIEAWDEMANPYGERCIDVWADYAPNVRDAVIEWAPYTPLDISRRMVNMVRGDWMGGLIDLDNLLTERPSADLAQYGTPLEGALPVWSHAAPARVHHLRAGLQRAAGHRGGLRIGAMVAVADTLTASQVNHVNIVAGDEASGLARIIGQYLEQLCRGTVAFRPSLKRPLFGYQAYRLMRLPGVRLWSGLPRPPLAFVVGGAGVLGAFLLARRLRQRAQGSDDV